jgi:dihydropteroate synthase
MLSMAGLAALVREWGSPEALPVPPVPLDGAPPHAIMGTLNLSRDSTYRESIATSVESAVRKARVMAAQGAHVIDIGAESTTRAAARVDALAQTAALIPVIERLTDEAIPVSVESYEEPVVAAALKAGARMVNLTGVQDEDAILELAARHDAAVVLCYVGGRSVREVTDVDLEGDPIPALVDHFGERIARARSAGVDRLVIDPGMGFYYGNLVDPTTRVRHQARILLQGYRLRVLGVPLCNALPHAFDLFEDEYRVAEGFFAVLAHLGGTSLFRTHEVSRVRATLEALALLDSGEPT